MTLKGIDVSVAQPVDIWNHVTPDIRFAFIRAGQSGERDPSYYHHASACRLKGIHQASYFVLQSIGDPEASAKLYHDVAGGTHDLPPCLDFELPDPDKKAVWGKRITEKEVIERAETFVRITEELWNKPCILYTFPNFWKKVVGDPETCYLSRCLLWIADYNKVQTPWLPAAWKYHTFHQYTDKGQIGPYHPVDLDRFNGSEEDLLEMKAWPKP